MTAAAQVPERPVTEDAPDRPAATDASETQARPESPKLDFEVPGVALNPSGTVKLDKANQRLLVTAQVCLREGVLEMLACKKQTKEHESILAIDADAFVIHTGLLVLKAEPGKPVQYEPEYKAPSGTRIDIFLNWKDESGKLRRVAAQKWIRHATRRYFVASFPALPADLDLSGQDGLKYDKNAEELFWYGPMSVAQRDDLLNRSRDKSYQKAVREFYEISQPRPMKANWVFVGSSFYEDEQTGERYYRAESGDVICVANFASAMLDVSMESSSQGSSSLLFEAATEEVPELGTPVMIELIPRLKKTSPVPAKPENTPAAPNCDKSSAD